MNQGIINSLFLVQNIMYSFQEEVIHGAAQQEIFFLRLKQTHKVGEAIIGHSGKAMDWALWSPISL